MFLFMREKGAMRLLEKYVAAQELIRLMIEESKKRGVDRPLTVLLEKLKQSAAQKGKPATGEELIAAISEYLKVDVRTLGRLDEQTQQNLVQEATEILAKERDTQNSQTNFGKESLFISKYYALNVLASIDEISLSEEWIKFLIEIVYNEKEDYFIRTLAATALARRVNHLNFDKTLEKLREPNSLPNKKKLDSIKKDLQKKSLRPAPR